MADKESADRMQGVYLAASGALLQFNAIIAAIHGFNIAVGSQGLLKAMAAGALLLHVLAALVLCWAVRPIVETPSAGRGALGGFVASYRGNALQNYQRGWRMTLLALTVSAAAAALFVLHAFGMFFRRF
jgi:hypothetical protein